MNTQEINRIVRPDTIHMSAHNDVISMVVIPKKVIPREAIPMEVVRVELLVQTFEKMKERIEQETDLMLEGVLDLEEEINARIEIVNNVSEKMRRFGNHFDGNGEPIASTSAQAIARDNNITTMQFVGGQNSAAEYAIKMKDLQGYLAQKSRMPAVRFDIEVKTPSKKEISELWLRGLLNKISDFLRLTSSLQVNSNDEIGITLINRVSRNESDILEEKWRLFFLTE